MPEGLVLLKIDMHYLSIILLYHNTLLAGKGSALVIVYQRV